MLQHSRIRSGAVGVLALILTAGAAHAGTLPFDPDKATRAWMATLGPEATARSNSYFEGGYWIGFAGAGITVAICALFLQLGWARGIRAWLERTVKLRFLTAFGFAAIFSALSTLMSLPFDFWVNFVREHDYGLSTQTLGAWAGEYATAFGVNLVITSLLIAILYTVVRIAKGAWWIWGAVVTIVMFAALNVLAPVYLSPLFNTYTPMAAGQLRTDILSVAQASGVPADNVYVFDASRQSNRVTANVSGFLGTTRISLADNLIKRTSPGAVRAVTGHEIGHYVLGHTASLLAMFAGLITIIFALLNWSFTRIARNERWGIRGLDDPAGLPLAIALISLVGVFATPVSNSIIRFHETQADIFGLNAARSPDGFAEAALLLSEYRKMAPGALEEVVFYDHPSGYNRIHMAMVWKAHEMAAGRYPMGPGGPPPGWKPDFVALKESKSQR